MQTGGEFKKLQELFGQVYLLHDPYVLKVLCTSVIAHRLDCDPVWIIVVAPSGGCKCLGKGTPVLMYDGTIKKIENIKVGDLVMGDDSVPRKVLSTTHGVEELFEVSQTRGDSYTINKHHILSLKQSNSRIEYKNYKKYSTIDVPLTDYLKSSQTFKQVFRGYKVPVEFKPKLIRLDPYLLGLWLGDGRRDSFSITTEDKEIINFIYDFAEKNNLKISTKKYQKRAQAYAVIRKKRNCRIKNPVVEILKSYGLMPKKFIPFDYKSNSKNIRLQVLAGLLDTDGTLVISSGKNRREVNKNFSFISKDKKLAEDVVFISRSLGFYASIVSRKIKLPGKDIRKTYWTVYISGNIEIIPTRIKRKKANAVKKYTNPQTTSIKIKALGKGDYFGFSLDGNGRFLLGDFTVTHNSELINALCQCKDINPLSTLTSKTFVSGQRGRGDKDPSLLMRINNGIITFKDMTSLLSEHKEDRSVIMAQLREIYDGRYAKSYGTGDTVDWKGKITVIAGATYAIHSMKQTYSAMGERFLFYNMIQPPRIEASSKAMQNQEEAKMKEKRLELATATQNLLDNVIQIPENLPKISEQLKNDLLVLAELATRARSDVERNWRSPQQEITEVHPPEMPTRFAGQLQSVAKSLMIINYNETGEMKLLEEDIMILNKLSLDSIVRSKRITMQELAKYDTIETSGLATKIGMPTNTIRLRLEDLTALEIVNRKKGGGSKGDRWSIKPNYRDIVLKFENLKRENGDLTENSIESDEEQMLIDAENQLKQTALDEKELPDASLIPF